MDLLSLPEEMLVSVLKYVDITVLTKCRQINLKIDTVAVRSRLNEPRLKTVRFTIWEEEIRLEVNTFNGYKFRKQLQFNNDDRDESCYTIVQNVYLKIRYTKLFKIDNCRRQQMKLPNSYLNMLIENSKKRKISGLSLFNLLLDVDFNLMRQFLTAFNIKHFSLPFCKTPNLSQDCSLFNGLSFEYLLFTQADLSLSDINMICKTNIPEKLWVRCKDITLKDAVNFLVDVVNRSKKSLNLSLYGIQSEGILEDAVKEILKPLHTYGRVEVSRGQVYICESDHQIIILLRF